ncbi:MAG TPA: hypothetical protein PK987_02945 [Ferruginibacter sp.]|nr:hypothetical protein [Ferruginibacter sp.]
MKKTLTILILGILYVSLCACPYSSAYTIDEKPSIYVEDVLIGNWLAYIQVKNSNRQESITMLLSKKSDTEYNISFTGYLDALKQYNSITGDSLNGTAFMSTIDDKQFLNIKINARVYIAQLVFNNNNLSLLPLAEHFTNKMIFNSQDLRNCISFHYKTRVHPVLDTDFSLTNMIKLN